MRIVFMGTPDFAVPSLQILIDAPDCDVVGVVTQPDRPAGRGQEVRMSPVKETALAASLPMIQPEKMKDAIEQIRAWQPEFLVVVAFGQILRQNLLDIPTIAPVNVHASLLPRWRGAAPIQASIRAGDVYSGITTMQMDAGIDTGPILLQDSIPIEPNETGQSLHDKLAPLGANLLIHTLRWLQSGSISPHDQPNRPDLITFAPQLKKEEGEIQWSQSAKDIDRHVRAFTPWPSTYTYWDGKLLKIISGFSAALDGGVRPGQVRESNIADIAPDTPIVIGTGSGVYIPTRLQLAGRQAVSVQDFLNGAPGFAHSQLGR